MDYTTISSAVTFTDVFVGLAVVYTAVAGLEIAKRGANTLISAIRGRS